MDAVVRSSHQEKLDEQNQLGSKSLTQIFNTAPLLFFYMESIIPIHTYIVLVIIFIKLLMRDGDCMQPLFYVVRVSEENLLFHIF